MDGTTLPPAHVRVPCSTSNLGSGFDCIGVALDRYLDVSFEPAASGGLHIERGGTLEGLPADVQGDVVAAAFMAGLGVRGASHVHGVLRMTSAIPVARGLGSSAAATVAGLVLAAVARGEPIDRMALLADATLIEGHPDNAAPALLGGLVGIARDAAGAPLPFRLPLSERIGFAYAAPPVEVSTTAARRALPSVVSHEVAVRSVARVAALAHGLATGDGDLLCAGLEDELHVPYRLPMIPGGAAAMRAGREAGAWAVTISGSGSGLIALVPAGHEAGVAHAMADAFRSAMSVRVADAEESRDVIHFVLRPDMAGVRGGESS
jgi:homoserine kinase